MPERIGTVVIGGGQAGLSVSRELTQAGVEHAVLERGRVAETWRGRWDSFCLVTPNWSVQLPGHPYDGDDPDGFMPRDELVAYLERYAAAVEAPVREGVEVSSLQPHPEGGFELQSSAGDIVASNVVLSTGAYQRPHRPAGAATLPGDLLQVDVEDYRNPGDLPAGPVLVVGSGQSGCQVAEELHEAGREVVLACGRAAGPRGGSGTATSCGGSTQRATSKIASKRCRSRAHVSWRTSRRRVTAAATTSTFGPSSGWA